MGAVATDRDYSIKAVGWNSTPTGQTPCLLRDAEELLSRGDKDIFSRYERKDKNFKDEFEKTYQSAVKHERLKGRTVSFCFKDIRNKVKEEKNQVHTRSLHAEENAFLQIAKYGGQPLKGGLLFTTASPCELCAKKAYQIGISKIVYLDPYPGIAEDNIIKSGIKSKRPKMTLYRGAVGRAYHRLYLPFMNYKDELELLTHNEIKKEKDDIECDKLKEENDKLKRRVEELEKAHKHFCDTAGCGGRHSRLVDIQSGGQLAAAHRNEPASSVLRYDRDAGLSYSDGHRGEQSDPHRPPGDDECA